MNEYITVKQFAAAAGVSAQRIYQRLDTNLKPFIKVVDGKKMLSVEGLKLFDIKDLEQDLNKPLKELEQDLELLQSDNETIKAENTKLSGRIKDLEQALETERKKSDKLTAENAALNKKIKPLEQGLEKSIKDLESYKKTLDGINFENNRNQIFYNTQKKALESKLADKDNIITELRAQIDGLRADKAFLQSQLTAKDTQLSEKDNTIKALTAEREQERKERQTILAELLQLRGQKAINVKAEPRPTGAATKQEPRAQERPHKKLSLREKLRAAADIFRK